MSTAHEDYLQGEVDRLTAELLQAQQALVTATTPSRTYAGLCADRQCVAVRNQLNAAKGQITKLRNRVEAQIAELRKEVGER